MQRRKMSHREDPLVRNKLKIELSKLLGRPGEDDIKEIDARYPNMEGMLEKRFHDVNNIIKNCLEGEDEELVSITLNVVKGTLKYSSKNRIVRFHSFSSVVASHLSFLFGEFASQTCYGLISR